MTGEDGYETATKYPDLVCINSVSHTTDIHLPALVVTCPGHYDVIRGSLPLQQALEKVAESGDCEATARHLLEAAK
ncbi:DUF5431 family protein [Enterobacter roggenkampii]|nr:DUF5431 family protein [Enterobacter roggenkampii]